MSCNGCRVLRKGCSEDCSLRPCLEWIKSPQSQANATLFLAKFYGRAGLLNLVNAAASHLRPEIFKSLMYEACGRIINPVHGSVGLMCSDNWQLCHDAVEAVMQGTSIISNTTTQVFGDDNVSNSTFVPFQGCDIRHLPKDSVNVKSTRKRFRQSRTNNGRDESEGFAAMDDQDLKFTITGWNLDGEDHMEDFCLELNRAPSQDSLVSAETVELALANRVENPVRPIKPIPEASEIGLELTLGFNSTLLIEISDGEV